MDYCDFLPEMLGHNVVCNVTKFQNCRGDNKFLIGEKPLRKDFDKNNKNTHYIPQNELSNPAISRARFTRAVNEETQLPMKCCDRIRMAWSIMGDCGSRKYTFTWNAIMCIDVTKITCRCVLS